MPLGAQLQNPERPGTNDLGRERQENVGQYGREEGSGFPWSPLPGVGDRHEGVRVCPGIAVPGG